MISRLLNIFIISILILSIGGCLSETSVAPVTNIAHYSPQTTNKGTYRVQPGDTLYSIAWAYGYDYRALAGVNHISPPYQIHPGQILRLTNKPIVRSHPHAPASQKTWVARRKTTNLRWVWPAQGKIIRKFSRGIMGNQGINIAGRFDEPVRAAAAGSVVYSGDGIRGYGNLIIIKHNDDYLSAYAYNERLLVKLGESVQAGQKIALMGRNDAGKVVLHFEIRHDGNPVNPIYYLN